MLETWSEGSSEECALWSKGFCSGQSSPLRHSSIRRHRRSELLSALKQRLIPGEGTTSSKRSQALRIKSSVADQAFHRRSALPSSLRPSVAAQVSIVEVEADPAICRRADRHFEEEGPILCAALDGMKLPSFPEYEVRVRCNQF